MGDGKKLEEGKGRAEKKPKHLEREREERKERRPGDRKKERSESEQDEGIKV